MRLILIVSVLLFVNCAVAPDEIVNKKDFARKITYLKDERTGLCFAGVATRKARSAEQNGIGLTCVPCESVPSELLE